MRALLHAKRAHTKMLEAEREVAEAKQALFDARQKLRDARDARREAIQRAVKVDGEHYTDVADLLGMSYGRAHQLAYGKV